MPKVLLDRDDLRNRVVGVPRDETADASSASVGAGVQDIAGKGHLDGAIQKMLALLAPES